MKKIFAFSLGKLAGPLHAGVTVTSLGKSGRLQNDDVSFEIDKANGSLVKASSFRGTSMLAGPGSLDRVAGGNNRIGAGLHGQYQRMDIPFAARWFQAGRNVLAHQQRAAAVPPSGSDFLRAAWNLRVDGSLRKGERTVSLRRSVRQSEARACVARSSRIPLPPL